MSDLSSVDIVALIEQLRRDKEAIEQDLVLLEGALAVTERRSLLSRGAATAPVSFATPITPLERTPTPPARRTIPRLSLTAERLSDERVKAFAQEIQGMTQIEAVVHVAARVDDFQNADIVKIIIEAGLSTGKRANVSSHIYRLIVDSGKFEKVGAGRFRLIDHPSQGEASQAGNAQATFPVENHTDTPM